MQILCYQSQICELQKCYELHCKNNYNSCRFADSLISWIFIIVKCHSADNTGDITGDINLLKYIIFKRRWL